MAVGLPPDRRHAAWYLRHDPLREAQELLAEQRSLAPPLPPKPAAATSSQPGRGASDGGGAAASPSGGATARATPRRPGPLPPADAGEHSELLLSARARQARGRQRGQRGSSIGGGSIRATAERWLRVAAEQQECLSVDHGRKRVLMAENRFHQDRWPAEARWAGHDPSFIKEKHDRLGTLRNERGDGRTLPHERPEYWWWS
mmetsp:Transcript_57495/g.162248  ORF Transcript_57495/g.162248 Transcript_57495/m.162248 type:complete len:202 (+) Transcript_57495:62-667(+)